MTAPAPSVSHPQRGLPEQASPADSKTLRRAIRRRRRALTPSQQREASKALERRLRRDPLFRFARRIALYQASARDGEIDPAGLLTLALRRGKRCHLPVMRRDGPQRLVWRRYRPGDALRRGPYGIMEPRWRAPGLPAWGLDLVLLPLVAFDPQGNRMGMGKGFYDRTFAFKRRGRRSRPRLVGLAHDCQKVEALTAAAWDVPLDAVVTPSATYHFQRR